MRDVTRNLMLRVGSAAVLGPIVAVVILWDRPIGVALLVLLAGAIATGEFYWIALRDDPVWMRLAGVCIGIGVGAAMIWAEHAAAWALVAATVLACLLHLFRYGDLSRATSNAAVMVFGVLYVPLLLSSVTLLKRLPLGGLWVIFMLGIAFASDTGAYFLGRAIGKHKLYPAVSPGKSVEGAFGGLLGAFCAGVIAKLWLLPMLSWLDVALLTLPGSALGQSGDLVESMIKRGYGAKDSSRLIPGHGGLLDRIDAVLFVAPYVYLYARYVVAP